jgi:hypothetical protein
MQRARNASIATPSRHENELVNVAGSPAPPMATKQICQFAASLTKAAEGSSHFA